MRAGTNQDSIMFDPIPKLSTTFPPHEIELTISMRVRREECARWSQSFASICAGVNESSHFGCATSCLRNSGNIIRPRYKHTGTGCVSQTISVNTTLVWSSSGRRVEERRQVFLITALWTPIYAL